MSCFERIVKFCTSGFIPLVLLVVLAGCTAQPLYSVRETGTAKGGKGDALFLSQNLTIDEARDRNSQILRNQILYLTDNGRSRVGGGAEAYRLSLEATTETMATVQVDVGDRTDRTGRPSAGTVRARASYVLRDGQGKVVAKGQRSMSAPFDRPRQEYANLQAEEDAKRRALEELAQQIVFALTQDMSSL